MVTTVLHVAPHPDDEALGAPCTLLRLRDGGARVIVVACGLGRPPDHARRRAELEAATATAGFELIVRDPPAALASDDDLDAAEAELVPWVTRLVDQMEADLVVSPHLHDVHPAHEAVARVVRDAIAAARWPPVWWAWGIWADVRTPTLLVPAAPALVDRALAVLDRYVGEISRNYYPDMLRAAGRLGAIRGPELVAGFGSAGLPGVQYAELLTEVGVVDGHWRFGQARVADPPDLATEWKGEASSFVDDQAVQKDTGHSAVVGGAGAGGPLRPRWRMT